MSKPVVMISHEMLAPVQAGLEAQGYKVVRRWDMTPNEGAETQAIVHAGEIVLTPEFLAFLPELKLIANVSVGYDGIDVAWCRARDIEVTHAEGLNAEDVADHAVGLLIASWRDIVRGDQMVRSGGWTMADRMGARPGLKGRKVGIMGLGFIGEAVASRVEAFGMQVAWWGPRPKPDARWPRAESLLAACRADASNRKAVDAEVIAAVGARGLIVNVARGSIIDEDALIAALKEGRLGRAALDVFSQEPTPASRWANVPGTVLTPHSAGTTVDSLPLMIGQCFENLRRFFADEALLSPVPD